MGLKLMTLIEQALNNPTDHNRKIHTGFASGKNKSKNRKNN